ncbi:MAG: hypothetical protein FWE13_02400 [Firmicutes bacterium]|nr:hypothetical protein [Bacillota bacterium]
MQKNNNEKSKNIWKLVAILVLILIAYSIVTISGILYLSATGREAIGYAMILIYALFFGAFLVFIAIGVAKQFIDEEYSAPKSYIKIAKISIVLAVLTLVAFGVIFFIYFISSSSCG